MQNGTLRSRIDHLVLYNFKSFLGMHVIGPLLEFTAIIGPNGGGKSNIMDAVSFVLGVRSHDLRASNLKELVFRRESERVSELVRNAYVELHFKTERELVFKRTISTTGASEYFINDSKVSWEEYQSTLEEFGIVVKARNFLIFQGQVDALAMKSGKELTGLFERISGSDECVKDYEETKTQLETAQENLRSVSNKVSFLKAEKKKLKDQRTHARHYENLLEKVKGLQSKFELLQFCILEGEIQHKQSKLQEKQSLCAAALENKEETSNELRDSEMDCKKVEQQILNLGEDYSNKNHLLLVKRPVVSKLKENIKQLQHKIQNKETALFELKLKHQRNLQTSSDLQNELSHFEEEIQKRIQMQSQELSIHLARSQQIKYLELKKQAGLSTFTERTELQRLKKDLDGKQINFDYVLKEFQEKQEELNNLQTELQALNYQLSQKNDQKTQVNSSLAETQKAYTEASRELETNQHRQNQLTQRLREVEAELREHSAFKNSKKSKATEQKVVSELMRQRKGVKGIFGDLVKPIQPKYEVAVEAALGSIKDYLVVDTADTVNFVNSKLKEHCLQKDVVVLENLPETRIQENTRQHVSSYGCMLVDLLDYDSSYGLEKAVSMFVGSKALAENIELANSLRTAEGIKQVVTPEGVTLKNGMISSAPKVRIPRNFSQQRLSEEAEDLKNQIEHLKNGTTNSGSVNTLKQSTYTLQNKLSALENEIKNLQERAKGIELAKATLNLEKLQGKLSEAEFDLEKQKQEVETTQKVIENIESNLFEEFCREIGVENIKQFEGKNSEEVNKLQQEINNLKQQKAKVVWQTNNLNLETSKENVEQTEASIQEDYKELEKQQQRLGSLEAELNSIKDKETSLKSNEDNLKAQLQRLRETHKNANYNFEKAAKKATKAEKETAEAQTELAHLVNQKKQRVEELLVSNLEVPMVQENNTQEVDLSALERKFTKMDKKQLEDECQKISVSIEKESKNLENLANTSRCTFQQEKLDEIESKIEETNTELEQCSKKLDEAKHYFQVAKEKRRSVFMRTFESVSTNINHIYKEMTAHRKNQYYGGNALLYLEDNEEPYKGGVVYSPTPPGKRCMYEMDQLSGGEKTIAALSLLFAIHTAMPSPFYILDEIDAALDYDNCQLILNYLQKASQERCQCVIITHKEEFFSNADSLIGATFLPQENTSRSFSLDLRAYGPKQLADV